MEQRGAAAVPVEKQTSLGCLCQAGDPSAPTGEGLSQPKLAPAMEHLAHTLTPAGVEGIFH